MSNSNKIVDWIEETPFIDTHEHLLEESTRVNGELSARLFPCDDWSYLFMHYLKDDLFSSGMARLDLDRFHSFAATTDEKFRLIEPYWNNVRHTGYGQAVRHTLKGLYEIDDLTAHTVHALAKRYRQLVKPGFYRTVLCEKSNIECCQVNSLQRIFMETEQPDLLKQDLSFVALSTGLDLRAVEEDCGKTAQELEGWLEIIDWYFATYGPKAVAIKNQSAYDRRLDFERLEKYQAAGLFARCAQGDSLPPDELKKLQDYLFSYCISKATEYGLPVKLHTGYYAGNAGMPLTRLRQNAGDLCPLLQDFPDSKFVLMHIGYPYQDEYIALAKSYPNVYIDLCWAWIINPAASVRFLKEFLMAAPSNKLLTFGGDYLSVETIYGHSRVARRGLAQALTELVQDGWIHLEECQSLVERLMNGNARQLFPAR